MTTRPKPTTHETTHIYEAAYLLASGLDLTNEPVTNQDRVFVFTFRVSTPEERRHILEWATGRATVNAHAYATSVKLVKSIIHGDR